LGVPESEIRSERDPKIQQEVLGIPSSSLGRHAVHRIVITNPEMELRMETRVLGKSAYASGLSKIIDMVTQSEMSPGIHDIVDLFINGMQTRA
jgi:hypothetical protein